jgi:hypothetical protein
VTVRLCALLWPHDGKDTELRRYEDAVLPLLTEHGGTLVARETVTRTSPDDPLEIHVLEFRDQAGLDGYLTDPRRLALEDDRVRAIARSQVLRLRA